MDNKEKAVHIREDCRELTGHHKGDVFHRCTFDNLNGLILEKCDLSHSKFTTDTLEHALNFTVTLNCLSFNRVEISPLLFDLLLCMLIKSAGNDEKRQMLVSVIGPERAKEILLAINRLE